MVLCDEDTLLREMVESLITRMGHEIVGIADTTVDGVHLVESAKPDLVVFDMTLGYNTDFDVIVTANARNARTLVFSHNADAAVLDRYHPRPTVVHKPDLIELERVLASPLPADEVSPGAGRERRRRPVRAASGPPSTNVADAQAFYEALSDLKEGDALLAIDVPVDGVGVGEAVLGLLRLTDRLVASLSSVRVFLPGAGPEGVASFAERLEEASVLPAGARVHHIVAASGETAEQAFERLKR